MLSARAKVLFTTALRSISSSSSSSSSASLPLRRRSSNASTRVSLHHFPRHFTIDRDLTAEEPDPPVSLAATTQPARTEEPTKEIAKDDDGGSEGRPQVAAPAVGLDPSIIQQPDAEVATLVPVEALEEKDDDVKKEAPFSGIATDVDEEEEEKKGLFLEIAAKVCEIIGREPEWEKVLVSHLPPSLPYQRYLFNPSFVRELLRSKPFRDHRQELPLRYFLWISGYESFSSNRINSTGLFHAFADARAWNAAVSVICSTKCDIKSSAIEPFIRVLCKNRAFGEVLEVTSVVKDTFGIMPSIPTWNSAIWGSLRAGRTDLVWMLYEIMDGYGACGNVFTIECLVQAFYKEKRLLEAFSFLRQVSRAGLIPNVGSFNKLVYGFCKEGDFGKVSDVLHLMVAIGQYPNMSTYQAIIHELCVRRRVDEAFQIFDRLKRMGYAPDVITYTTIINGLCKGRRIADAQMLWREMTVLGIEPNRCTYNTLLDGYFKTGNLCEAQNLYNEMLKKGHMESTVTCNTLIAGLCQNGRTSEALNVFEEMRVKCIEHDVITYNTLIQGFCNDGKTVEARNFFRQLLESRLQPSERSYPHLICALSKEGSVHEAAELFSDLESRGLKASNVLHEYMISGFCNVDDVGQGMVWLWKMLNSDLQPSEVTFNEFISRLTLANRVDDAFLVLELMLQFGHSLKRWTCGSLIHRLCRTKCDLAGNHLAEIIAVA